MSEITITNLNNIINDYRKKEKDLKEKNSILKSRIKTLEEQLKKERKG